MRKMKFMKVFERITLALALLFLVGNSAAWAQDEEITDDDLKAYAAIQMSVDVISTSVKPTLLNMIEQQEGMTTKRYMELKQGQGEAAQEWETEFLNLINEMAKKRSEAAKEVLNLIINNSTLNSAKYAKIKDSLENDADLKARYEEVTASLP